MFQKVENVKHPLKKGEKYAVPCIVRHEDDLMFITPVINHPHNDKENGQKEVHYHADYRFIKHKSDNNFPTIINNHSKHVFAETVRPQYKLHGNIEYYVLPVINEGFAGVTNVEFIAKSKLKHKCIHEGKCPHRGYDLSQVSSINGKITCPLHGLQFDAETGLVIYVGVVLVYLHNGKRSCNCSNYIIPHNNTVIRLRSHTRCSSILR